MSRREKGRAGRVAAVEALARAGDHRGAIAEARRTLADPAASAEEQEAARTALASFRPEPGAVLTGVVGVIIALATVLWTVLST